MARQLAIFCKISRDDHETYFAFQNIGEGGLENRLAVGEELGVCVQISLKRGPRCAQPCIENVQVGENGEAAGLIVRAWLAGADRGGS